MGAKYEYPDRTQWMFEKGKDDEEPWYEEAKYFGIGAAYQKDRDIEELIVHFGPFYARVYRETL